MASAASAVSDGEVSPGPALPDAFEHVDLSRYSLDHHLLHESLAGAEKGLELYRLYLSKDKRELFARARLGEKACGHPHIVHGGAISSLFDDALGTLFIGSGYHGFTANLSVDFRKPLPASTNIVIHASIDRVETSKSGSKKVYLKARMADAGDDAVTYSEATALFIGKAAAVTTETTSTSTVDGAPKPT